MKKRAPTFGEVLAGFRKHQRQGKSPKTITKEHAQDALFLQLIDSKTPIDEIERVDCRRVQEIITRLPANFSKLDVDPRKILDSADTLGPKMGAKPQNSYLSPFAAIFRYAIAEGILEKSPAERLRVQSDGVRACDRRLPFSDDDLQRIFDPKHFPPSAEPASFGCRRSGSILVAVWASFANFALTMLRLSRISW